MKRKNLPLPSKKIITDLLDYNAATGDFIWKKVNSNFIKVGDIAGYVVKSKYNIQYRIICINNIKYKAHRIAYFLQTGLQPDEIDHKNGNGLDNRFTNLRASNDKLNANNQKKRVDNRSGIIGVHYDKYGNRWRATLGDRNFQNTNNTRKNFKCKNDAIKQRKIWEDIFGMTELKKDRK